MMPAIYISLSLVLLAAAVDALRIRLRWGATGNIDHFISGMVGTALCAGQWVVQHPGWHWASFAGLCFGMRLLFYDPVLNLMRRERLTYVSTKTSAVTATWWRRLNITFWQLRAAGAIMLAVTLVVQLFL